ncbi:hypothetical protein TYRP_018150, partial [Tyrophagus putrescentiae]
RLVECPCSSKTSIARVLPEISAFEVPILVSCIASTTGTPDSCQQAVSHGGDVQCCSDLLLRWPLFTCLVDAEESRRVGLSARCCSLPAAWPAPAAQDIAEDIDWPSYQDQPATFFSWITLTLIIIIIIIILVLFSLSPAPAPHQPGLFPSDKYYGHFEDGWMDGRHRGWTRQQQQVEDGITSEASSSSSTVFGLDSRRLCFYFADISGSTRAIEVSLAQGHSTKRSASNGTIKRGGRIFGQIGQIYYDRTRQEDSKSERVFAPGPREHERLVECPCASETSIARVLPEISALEVPILVSCIASTTGTPDSCQQTVCLGRRCRRRHSRLICRTDTDEDGHAAATAAVADSAHARSLFWWRRSSQVSPTRTPWLLSLSHLGWHPRPHTGLKITTTTITIIITELHEPQDRRRRRPGWTTPRMDDDQDNQDGRLRRPTTTTTTTTTRTTRMDDRDGRWRRRKPKTKTKTEDRRRGEEAGNRTVALPKRQSTLAVDLLKRWGTPAIKWCAACAWSVSTGFSSLHIGWVPQDITVPPRTWGGPKRTVDKDGRLSEDGEADGGRSRRRDFGEEDKDDDDDDDDPGDG